jgi:hypothetical protein
MHGFGQSSTIDSHCLHLLLVTCDMSTDAASSAALSSYTLHKGFRFRGFDISVNGMVSQCRARVNAGRTRVRMGRDDHFQLIRIANERQQQWHAFIRTDAEHAGVLVCTS